MFDTHLILVLETSKGKKTLDQKSDELYISKLLKYFYDLTNVKISFVYMCGKGNYDKFENDIDKINQAFKDMNDNIVTRTIFVMDKDNFDSVKKDEQDVAKVTSYCEQKNYDLIWFVKDIEHVLLGQRTNSNKTAKARSYSVEPGIKRNLNMPNPMSDKSSNFGNILNRYLKNK